MPSPAFTPPILFRVASPKGDLTIPDEHLDTPLEGCPEKTTYRAYFSAIAAFVRGRAKARILAAIQELHPGTTRPVITQIIVLAEKHGAFYHPASVEILCADSSRFRFGVLVAAHSLGRLVLSQEVQNIRSLHRWKNLTHVPRVYGLSDMDGMTLALVEWFNEFHEFHADQDGRIVLWEFGQGDRILTEPEAREVYRGIGRILILSWDKKTLSQILMWHHAAGDFIARMDNGQADVRLTTIRSLGPGIKLPVRTQNKILLGLFLFFLDTGLRLRLDRVDGTKAMTWLGAFALSGGVQGFLEGLQEKDAVLTREFIGLISPMTSTELHSALRSLLPAYHDDDLALVKTHLSEHAQELKQAIALFGLILTDRTALVKKTSSAKR